MFWKLKQKKVTSKVFNSSCDISKYSNLSVNAEKLELVSVDIEFPDNDNDLEC